MLHIKPSDLLSSHESVQVVEFLDNRSFVSLVESVKQNVCELCNKCFTRRANLKRHVRVVHFGAKVARHFCNKKYSRTENLNTHIKDVHSQNLGFDFSTCNKKFHCEDNSNSSVNLSSEVNDKILTNEILEDCTRRENILNNTSTQILMNSKVSKPVVESCDKNELSNFINKDNKLNYYINEELNAQGNPGLECELCDKVFDQRVDFLNHFHIDEKGSKPYVCKFCRKQFSKLYNLKRHEKIHLSKGKHVSSEILDCNHTNFKSRKEHKCQICDRIFDCKRRLELHLKTNHNNTKVRKQHTCIVCNKIFNKESRLKSHYLLHTGEKPFVCEICSFGTTQRSILNRHMQIHTGEKPYKCDICGKFFRRKSHCNYHLHTHKREKLFVCDICKKAFWLRDQLDKHYMIHTGRVSAHLESQGKSSILVLVKIHHGKS